MEVLLSLYELYSLLVFLKTLKAYAENLKTFIRKSSPVFCFDFVYVRDVAEDPEDLYKLYYSLI